MSIEKELFPFFFTIEEIAKILTLLRESEEHDRAYASKRDEPRFFAEADKTAEIEKKIRRRLKEIEEGDYE